MTKTIYILNGPNLNLLGKRQPDIYGSVSLKDIETSCKEMTDAQGWHLVFRQTNHEGVLIDWVQEARENACALLINAGGLSHTSVSLLDALLMLDIPIYEVHISQIYQRDSFRHHSFVSSVAQGIVAGFGANGYMMALKAALAG